LTYIITLLNNIRVIVLQKDRNIILQEYQYINILFCKYISLQ